MGNNCERCVPPGRKRARPRRSHVVASFAAQTAGPPGRPSRGDCSKAPATSRRDCSALSTNGDVFEPALDLAPLPALQGAGATNVVIEGHVLQGQEQCGRPCFPVQRSASSWSTKRSSSAAFLGEIFEVLAELVDHDEDRRVLA